MKLHLFCSDKCNIHIKSNQETEKGNSVKITNNAEHEDMFPHNQ